MNAADVFSVRRNPVATLIASTSLVLVMSLVFGASAQADLSFESISFRTDNAPAQKFDEAGNPVFENGLIINFTTGDAQEFNLPTYESTGTFTRQAGSHPDFSFSFSIPINPDADDEGQVVPGPDESVHAVETELPPGMIGNPTAIPTCDTKDLAFPGGHGQCPLDTQVGVLNLTVANGGGAGLESVGIYNMTHGPDVAARFGFNVKGVVAYIDAGVRPGDYAIVAGSRGISQALAVSGATVTLWGVPADPSHDGDREGPFDIFGPAIHLVGVQRAPFMSAPTSCPVDPLAFTVRGDAWTSRGIFDERSTTVDSDGTPFIQEGCEKLPFAPSIGITPSTHAAASPAGLSVDLTIPQSKDPDGLATSHLRNVKMTLPPGMTLSSSAASGLGSCSSAEIDLASTDAPTCPNSSKIGTVRLETPVLDEELEGDVIIAKQNDNPFNSLLALYISIKGPGFYVKLPGKVTPDPETGQLTVTFDENPQVPFERLQLQLNSGSRAPLVTPNRCGTYQVQTELTPWSGTPPVTIDSPITIDQGCATGGFSPQLEAGTVDPTAGAFSPFVLRITRSDGEENLKALSATLPEGLLAKLAGVALCGDAQAATGDCPASSQIGSVTVGTGAGPNPLFVPEAGKAPTAAYLAGPYKGAPYSLVAKVPAQAGPFDLGTVAIRNALKVNPVTAQVTAVSDPLPQILQGIPIAYRDIRVQMTRPEFTINPTDCDSAKVTSTLTSAVGQTANPSSPFAASDCAKLGFKPKLKLALKGAVHRRAHPALSATLTARPGDANIAGAQVKLPKAAFLDNAHIGTPCTRVQFAAGACPADSVIGKAEATSPLLGFPVAGPVYLRSNPAHELPDVVASLSGPGTQPIAVELAGKTDSVKGALRNTFEAVPDVPVTKFSLQLFGGKKGLIEMSSGFCANPRATVKFDGQNGASYDSKPKVAGKCGKGKKG